MKVKLMKLLNGELLVGQHDETSNSFSKVVMVHIEDVGDGKLGLGFLPVFFPLDQSKDVSNINPSAIICMIDANSQLEQAYLRFTSGLIIPGDQGAVAGKLSLV